MTENDHLFNKIREYYLESEGAYWNWGKDEDRDGIYALHCGFALEGQNSSHYREVKELSRRLIQFAQIPPNSTILDAGCGAGALSYELITLYKDARVLGINISHNQLVSADAFRVKSSARRIHFCEQDYHNLAFPNGIFDAVIFCESYIHSPDKKGLAKEVFRVVKPGGIIAMSDTFINQSVLNIEEIAILNDLMAGWYLPNIATLQEQKSILVAAGFQDVIHREHTSNILASAIRMREHAEQRVKGGDKGSDILQLSRKSTIACGKAFEKGLTSYCFVRGHKPPQ